MPFTLRFRSKYVTIHKQSATEPQSTPVSLILTDPPYYDAIPYSDLMDFFHIFLRRVLRGLCPAIDQAFDTPLSPKWDRERNDGELIDDESRFDGNREKSKKAYEDGMAKAFQNCLDGLEEHGRLVVVFANKEVVAWETLIAALIRSGAVVTASWPIQTERTERVRNVAAAGLASSVWIVCRKREILSAGLGRGGAGSDEAEALRAARGLGREKHIAVLFRSRYPGARLHLGGPRSGP